ncbi:hypothetical protein BH23ACT2_BH23ACT2_17640 [soil metagenome]
MHDEEVELNDALVRRLLASQMPDLADRPLTVVEPWGTANGIWRLGEDLVVRLPRIHWAAGQVDWEASWLPRLAPHLPVAIPEPVAVGEPDDGYPYRWAVHRWIPGDGAALDRFDDPGSTSPIWPGSSRPCRPTVPPRPATAPGRSPTTTSRRAGPSTTPAT